MRQLTEVVSYPLEAARFLELHCLGRRQCFGRLACHEVCQLFVVVVGPPKCCKRIFMYMVSEFTYQT